MEWRVLGPLEVWSNGSPVSLGGRQRRLVLAILLANADQAVSTDKMIEEVWGDSPPDSARKTVQAHVAHLRSAVNLDSEFLSPAGDGYVLAPGGTTVDADRFEAALAEAKETSLSDPARLVSRLDEALAMFRGEPYAGLADDALTVKIEAARLGELRLTSREDRLDALLAAGDTGRVAAEVERMLAEHPLRERLWAIQMLALYRSGRQAEALNSFSRARQILGEELGIEPSNELKALEQQILEQDSSLLESSKSTTGGAPTVEVRRNPYKGLRAFDEADANDFYGRAELVRQLADRLTKRPPAALTVVAGPSGAGKSSVVRAGLLPALRDADLLAAVMFPGDDPGEALDVATREALVESSEEVDDSTVDVVVVDQFEEIFTMTPEDRAENFIARLIDTADPTLWVVTVRADFLGDLLAHPELGRRLQESLVLVPPLKDHGVEAAIVEPARHVGVDVEPSLVATLVGEVGARASALPLMQYAMTDLFERRRGDMLTLDSYKREGGLSGALVRRADQVFQRLSDEGREAARQIFLQLVTIADNGEFARRRVQRDGLEAIESHLTNHILEEFGAQRLLTFDQDPASGVATVELAHESLLEVWPLLGRWVDETREDLLLRSALNTALAEWEVGGRDPSFLLSGGRLAQHEAWTAETDLVLTQSENEFLLESRQHTDEEEARHRRRRNWITASIGLAAAVAIIFGVIAVQQAATADETERIAKAADLAAAANDQLEADPELAVLLAMEAVELTRRVDGTVLPVAEEALHRAVLADRLLGSLDHFNEGVAHFSPDGRSFVTSSDELARVAVWSVEPFEWRFDLVGHTSEILDAVFDPAGEWIATTSFDGTARVWDADTGEIMYVIDPPGQQGPFVPVFSNDGSMLATSIRGGAVSVWDAETGAETWSSPLQLSGALNLEFSPEDTLLVLTQQPNPGETVDAGPLLFDVATGELEGTLTGHAAAVLDVGFTPDGSRILTSSIDTTVKIWDANTRENLETFRGHRGEVLDLQISEDGTTVASSGEVDVLVWDLATLQIEEEIYGHEGVVDGIDLSPDASLLLTSSYVDLTTKLWDLTPWNHELTGFGLPEHESTPDVFRGGDGTTPGDLVYHPDGEQISASSGSESVSLWNVPDAAEDRTVEALGPVSQVDFDDSGELLAIAGVGGAMIFNIGSEEQRILTDSLEIHDVTFGADGQVATASGAGIAIWEAPDYQGRWIPNTSESSAVALHPDGTRIAADPASLGLAIYGFDGEPLAELYPPPPSPAPPVINALSFSPDGEWMVSAGDDWKAVLWSAEDFERVYTLEGHADEINDAVFHPSLPELATAGADDTIKFWDVETGTLRLSIPAPSGVTDIDYSPDGRHLAALSEEGFVTIYVLDVAELVAEAETRLTRWWTETECRQYLDSDTCPDNPNATATTTTAPSSDTTPREADPAPTTATPPDTTASGGDVDVLTSQGAPISEGVWRVETLGSVFDVEIEGDWWVQPNESGWIVFTDPDSAGPGDRDVVFMRPTALSAPTVGPESGEHWPLDDIEGWLEVINDSVTVAEPADAEIGGAEGIVFEVEIPADSLAVEFIENSDVSDKRFDPNHRYIVYWLDQGDHEPIVIIVGEDSDSFNEWAPTAESLLETVTFGEPAPHPNP